MTVVEHGPQLLGREDADVAEEIRRISPVNRWRSFLEPTCCGWRDDPPPLARVGLSEREALQQGVAVRVANLPMTAMLWTRTTGETASFMRVVVEAAGERILGFTMIGSEAGDVMAAVQTTMLGGLPYTVLRDAILTHPTMAEGLNALFAAIPARPR